MKLPLPYRFVVLLFFTSQLYGQPAFHYLEKLTIEDGLSSNSVTDVVQDGDGYLWIGTSYGLNRYDGTEVVKFFAENNGHSLPNNKINDLELLDSFHIAIATNYGLSIFDTRNETFRNIIFKREPAFESYDNYILFITRDKLGSFWVSSLTSLYRFDASFHLQKTFRSEYKTSDLKKYRISYISKIIPLETGDLLLWTLGNIWKWNHINDKIEVLDLSPGAKFSFLRGIPYPYCFKSYGHYLVTIHNQKIFLFDELSGHKVSTDFFYNPLQPIEWSQTFSTLQDGYIAFSLANKGFIIIKINEPPNSLSISIDSNIYFKDNNFRKWKKDNEGNWWVTTLSDGLIKFSPQKQLFNEINVINPTTNKPSNYEIPGFYKSGQQLFAATYGDGIYELNPSSGKFLNYKPKNGNPFQNIIWNIHTHSKDILWVGTSGGLLSYSLKQNKFTNLTTPHPGILDSFTITTDFIDSKGLLWMGVGSGNGVCVYNKLTGKFTLYPNKEGGYPFRYPLSIAEDSAANLWFLSDNTHDLVKWNRSTKQFKTVSVSIENANRNLPTGKLYLDKQGVIWFGVEPLGLVAYNTHSENTKIYGLENGLNTNVINDITEDKSHRLWLATNQGLSIFNKITKQFINITAKDGLPKGNYSSEFYYDSSFNRMYTGIAGKIIYFSPTGFTKHRSPMKVVITRIMVNEKPIAITGKNILNLSNTQNNLTIHFTGINLTNGPENNYAYKLGKKNAKWINIGHQRQINFANLKPGTYHFTIRASRYGGSPGIITDHFTFIIKPPFTSTIWFYLLILGIISGGIYTWYRYRLQQIMKLEKIRSNISHDLHDEIGSRLTNISMMSMIATQLEPDNTKTGEWLERIKEESQAVSQNMREIVWSVNPNNDSLEEALPRMLRYTTDILEAKGIEVKVSIADLHGIKMDMEKRRDLFLLFKEAIQNVLKHAEATSIAINMNVKENFIFLNIIDDGKGFEPGTLPFVNGLAYMKQRALQHHWNFEIHSKIGVGTVVKLTINTK